MSAIGSSSASVSLPTSSAASSSVPPASSSFSSSASQETPNYQELTNQPSITLPFAEDAQAEGEAEVEAEVYNFPAALEPRRHGGSRWFSKELRCLLFGFGDDENPYTGEHSRNDVGVSFLS